MTLAYDDEAILTNQELALEHAAKRLSAVRVCHRCTPYLGATLATICRDHLTAPDDVTRANLLMQHVVTRADAFACLDVLERHADDRELVGHLIGGLRSFLAVA